MNKQLNETKRIKSKNIKNIERIIKNKNLI